MENIFSIPNVQLLLAISSVRSVLASGSRVLGVFGRVKIIPEEEYRTRDGACLVLFVIVIDLFVAV